MSFIRTTIPAVSFKPVVKRKDFTIFRWDEEKEIITIPPRKKGEEPIRKETGKLICTECIIHGEVTVEMLQKEIDADLAIRYTENPPIIDAKDFIK